MLSTLAAWQTRTYLDTFDIYREVTDPDTGDSLGYQLVFAGEPCHFHEVANYDAHSSPAGMSKQEQLQTANSTGCALGLDVQPLDLMLVHKRTGDSHWQSVRGEPTRRQVLGYMKFYTVVPGLPESGPVIYTP